ncbi:MAG: VOC family protein [Pseudomonadota bacterium]
MNDKKTGSKGRVIGLGGVFFRSPDKEALRNWYVNTLGMPDIDEPGVSFPITIENTREKYARTVWTIFEEKTDYFGPSKRDFMVNLMVDDLDAVLARAKAQGAHLIGEPVTYEEYGKFGWVMDPEGTKIELWEPPNRPKTDQN